MKQGIRHNQDQLPSNLLFILNIKSYIALV